MSQTEKLLTSITTTGSSSFVAQPAPCGTCGRAHQRGHCLGAVVAEMKHGRKNEEVEAVEMEDQVLPTPPLATGPRARSPRSRSRKGGSRAGPKGEDGEGDPVADPRLRDLAVAFANLVLADMSRFPEKRSE
jgi:hypothetical protein